jgi:integrase
LGEASAGKHPRGGFRTSPATPPSQAFTFVAVAETYISAREGQWSRRHAAQWRSVIRDYCEPIINIPIPDITTSMVIRILSPIWTSKHETARRLRERIEAVLSAGYVQLELVDKANPARWKGWLDKSLPEIDRHARTRSHPAMASGDIPKLLARLRAAEGVSPRCLELTILTAVRTGNARLAKWVDIDLKRRIWEIPGSQMKVRTKTPFRVPLSSAVVKLLERLRADAGANEYVFTAPRSKRALSSEAMRQFLRRMGIADVTIHGFRASFATWAQNAGMPRDLREQSLAHVLGDRTERAYARSDAFELRAKWMEKWGRYCTSSVRSK